MFMKRFLFPVLLACTCLLAGCKKNEIDQFENAGYVRKYWNANASSNYEVPITLPTERKANMFLNLLTNNKFYYDILLDTLPAGDQLSGAALYYGTPAAAGQLLTDLKPSFDNPRHTKGFVTLTAAQADSLMSGSVFINLSSRNSPNGLARLQLDRTIDFFADIPLSPANVVPAASSSATGKVVIRLTADKILYYQLMVTGLENADALLEAHLHNGAKGINGNKVLTLASVAADYNKDNAIPGVADSIINTLKTAPAYIDVHSRLQPAGVLRGQLH